MRTEEGALATAQLDAFHESFNFCIDCRQYTCVNCWNDDCRPLPQLRRRSPASTTSPSDWPRPPPQRRRRRRDATWPMTTSQAQPRPRGVADVRPPGEPSQTNGHAASRRGRDARAPGRRADARAATSDGCAEDAEPRRLASRADGRRGRARAGADGGRGRAAEPELAEPRSSRSRWSAEVEPEPEPVVAEVEPEPEPLPKSSPSRTACRVEPEPVRAEVEPSWPRSSRARRRCQRPPLAPEPEPIAAGASTSSRAASRGRGRARAGGAEVEPEPSSSPRSSPSPSRSPRSSREPVVAEVEPEPSSRSPSRAPAPRIAADQRDDPPLPERAGRADAAHRRLAAEDDSPELAARRAQLDLLGLGDPGSGPVLPEPSAISLPLARRRRHAG